MKMLRRAGFTSLATSGLLLVVGAGLASAHVDPDPVAIEAGKPATVAFNIEHGCSGLPTISLAFKVPDGVTDAVPVSKDGWTSTAADGVITFSGGSLGSATPDSFSISFTAPATAGVIRFPVVQTCVQGELSWIEIPVDGQPEPEYPAPTITVTDGPPTSAQLVPPTDDDSEETIAATETAPPSVPVTAAPVPAKKDDGTSTGTIVLAIAGIVVVVAAVGLVFAARKSKSQPGHEFKR